MTSTPSLRPIAEADVPAVLALNHRFVDLLSPLDAERLLWLVGLADHADVVEVDDRVVGFVLTMAPGSEYDSENYRWHAHGSTTPSTTSTGSSSRRRCAGAGLAGVRLRRDGGRRARGSVG